MKLIISSRTAIIATLVLVDYESSFAFSPSSSSLVSPKTEWQRITKPSSSSSLLASSISETSNMINSIRSDLAQNEDANNIMKALRGQGMNDDDQAAQGLQMRLVDEDLIDGGTGLPYVYDPKILKEYYSKRPLLVLKRLVQVITVGGGFFGGTLLDKIFGGNDPDLEVKRAGELRDLITSLGPFYIKLGQALSIRPDVLSPRSMVELQKLCDKVPSYDSKIAFQTIERELERSVDELFSEITPEPVAAASLGYVNEVHGGHFFVRDFMLYCR